MQLNVPRIFEPLYAVDTRYYFLKGGRGSGKSWAVVDHLLFLMIQDQSLNLICLREVQRSIKHSSKKLIEDRIEYHELNGYFEIKDAEIRCRNGAGIIIFQGLQQHTVDSVKSLENFNLAFIEEAMTVSSYSLELLTPTIRALGAKLFFVYNPKSIDDPVRLLEQETPENRKVVIHANYLDNPYCPESIRDEAEAMKIRRLAKYNHIYLGGYGVAEGLIFENVSSRVIREEEVKKLECLQGGDFGFTNDPSTFSVNYIDYDGKNLYIFDGFSKKGMSNTMIAKGVKALQAHRHITRWDSAEPKSIAQLNTLGVRSISSEKGADSVIAGISYMQEYDIIINAHLSQFITSFNNYAWKTDRLTGKPLNEPNHDFSDEVDGVRYALSHLYKRRGRIGRVVKPKGL